jgi:threonine synthase
MLTNPGPLSVWRYADLLPVALESAVTIAEGGTGLSKSRRISIDLKDPELFFKFEGQNPTGSFKDRGMTVAISRAIEVGTRTVLCASTGNTSASMAAYAAKAGLQAVVLIPKGKIAKGKLVQAIIHGAKITEIKGNFDVALERARAMSGKRDGLYLANSINPYRIEGQKTIAFEIFEQLNRKIPEYVFLPVGNAGNICALWKGFKELKKLGIANGTPKMIGVQASGAAPIADAFTKGANEISIWETPETCASAIRIGAPARWRDALAAARESGGSIIMASDREILRAQRLMAEREGIFAEPASAAPLAGLMKYKKSHQIAETETVVCVVTGHGLKDQKSVLS